MVRALSNPVGRPSKYTPAILEKANAYLKDFNKKHSHAVPSVAGLAKVLNLSRDTLYDWSKQEDKVDFSYTLAKLMSDQEFELLNGGLSGAFNPAITKLMLFNHGHSEKIDQNVTSDIIISVNQEDVGVL